MTPFTHLIIFFVSGIIFISVLAWRSEKRAAKETIAAFEKAFPGRCPVCAYHRYGLQEGHVTGPVHPHICPEGKGGQS